MTSLSDLERAHQNKLGKLDTTGTLTKKALRIPLDILAELLNRIDIESADIENISNNYIKYVLLPKKTISRTPVKYYPKSPKLPPKLIRANIGTFSRSPMGIDTGVISQIPMKMMTAIAENKKKYIRKNKKETRKTRKKKGRGRTVRKCRCNCKCKKCRKKNN